MPNGVQSVPMTDILSYEEIAAIATTAAKLGICHIKVTGGEPLVRRGCPELVAMLKAIPGIEKVTLTTNGVLLSAYLEQLQTAGIDGINVSLDTTDPKRYAAITGADRMDEVLASIRKAAQTGIPVKINAVALPELAGEWEGLLSIARQEPVDVRFIELMPIGYGKQMASIGNEALLAQIRQKYPLLAADEKPHGYGPAIYYRIPGFQGSVGFISAIHGKFCDSCNRIRLTAQGYLKTCLCYEDGVDLRAVLRSREYTSAVQKEAALMEAMEEAIEKKPAAHCFDRPEQITEQQDMVRIGG
jgi:cyclic pyranopterin phosphate synthase